MSFVDRTSCLLATRKSFVDRTPHVLSEICNRIEQKNNITAPKECLTLNCEVNSLNPLKVYLEHGSSSFELYLDDGYNDVGAGRRLNNHTMTREPKEWLILICHEVDSFNHLTVELGHGIDDSPHLYLDDDYNDVDAWRRLGRATRNNHTITHVKIDVGEFVHPAAGCFDAFYDQLKHNKSIQYLDLEPIGRILPNFDLGYFLKHNANIKHLVLSGGEQPVTAEQSNWSTSLANTRLREFGILDLEFENNGVFEQIISACLGVKKLEVCCQHNFQYTALAALLQDRRAILQRVLIQHSESIMASLVGNTELKELVLPFYTQEARNDFDLLLCDSSTIEQIRNSNHTIETVKVESYVFPLPARGRARECLLLNKNENKNKVIQSKIMQYYFIGEFDLAPFSTMPASVLAEVMSCGKEMSQRQTAIFELLIGIPDLCNVSSRSVQDNIADVSPEANRHKVQD
jgi:hypothetical protein